MIHITEVKTISTVCVLFLSVTAFCFLVYDLLRVWAPPLTQGPLDFPKTKGISLSVPFPVFQQEDAEKLYKGCKRYDLLNNFYQASGQWQQALETAESRDRIHLRTTYYNYAKYLESMGEKTHALT